jgi:uncharacterized protein (TIGR00369 family)
MDNTPIVAKSSYIFFSFNSYIHIGFNFYILIVMSEEFEQISLKPGFMKHNGGLLFKTISENEYQFKTIIKENHLNAAGITHGGFIAAVVDAGAGTAAHRSADQRSCVTISLELKFISAVKLGQELIGTTKIQKKTKSMIFLTCELKVENKIAATASGIWKILKLSGAGPGG